MDKVVDFLMMPVEWIKGGLWDLLVGGLQSIAIGIIDNSYHICLWVGLIAILLYALGNRKAGKYIPGSIVIYYILQGLKMVIV